MAFATIGTTVKIDNTAVTGIQSIGDLEGDPSTIDVTTLADDSLKSIPGLRQDAAIAIVCFKDETAGGGNFEALKGLADGKDHNAEIDFPDGSKLAFPARVSVRLNAVAVNAAQQFTLTLFKTGADIYTASSAAN